MDEDEDSKPSLIVRSLAPNQRSCSNSLVSTPTQMHNQTMMTHSPLPIWKAILQTRYNHIKNQHDLSTSKM